LKIFLLGNYENTVILAHRGACRFDKKALNAQEAGARMLIVTEVEDNSLQRLGELFLCQNIICCICALVIIWWLCYKNRF